MYIDTRSAWRRRGYAIILADRRTCVSLEEAFWKCLRKIARERDETLSSLVSRIDANRQNANLSSAIRVFILEYYMDQFARRSQAFRQRKIPVQ
jgi:predicted DNA-binding ribbon-helix-helix protein